MYSLLKLLHVLAVVLFLGNIITGLFWHAHAARTRDATLLAHVMDGVMRSDRWFTMPAVVAIIATGIATAMVGGFPILRTGWIAWTLVLFAVSGIVFALRVAPLQHRLRELARAGQQRGDFDYAAYRELAVRWEWWGALALVTPLGGLVLMVVKPDL